MSHPPRTLPDVAGTNTLYYGDNLDVLRQHIASESVDLVYLDPPFNSNATYNVLFKSQAGQEAQAQLQAFDDTWHWSPQCEEQYLAILTGSVPARVASAVEALRKLLSEHGDMMAYLVMMAPRLVELRRVLKPTGSLYLHCDPTASHYLKLLLDATFGAENFQSEITWQRTNARSTTGRWPRLHDVILYYGNGPRPCFRTTTVVADTRKMPHTLITGADGEKYQTYELTGPGRTREGESGRPWRGFDPDAMGRHWGTTHIAMDEMDARGLIHWPGRHGFPRRRAELPFDDIREVTVGDVWTDIDRLNQAAKERLGYPTQKPLALLERIIKASSNPGDVVLDPFCGCGTTIDAAQKLDRQWVGIDITYLAVDLIRKRLFHTFGPGIENTYTVHGIPTDREGAAALFDHNPFDFERWAVSMVRGQPNDKQVGDKGIDGRIRFFGLDSKICTAIVSVKGGAIVGPSAARDLVGTVANSGAEMGILVMLHKPSPGTLEVAAQSGNYVDPITETSFPRIQVLTVEQLLAGERPKMPLPLTPYIKAASQQGKQLTFGGGAN
jgi:site-specific DNA-methyltransferase (adenine-specific)